jgi:hypothetical protein
MYFDAEIQPDSVVDIFVDIVDKRGYGRRKRMVSGFTAVYQRAVESLVAFLGGEKLFGAKFIV